MNLLSRRQILFQWRFNSETVARGLLTLTVLFLSLQLPATSLRRQEAVRVRLLLQRGGVPLRAVSLEAIRLADAGRSPAKSRRTHGEKSRHIPRRPADHECPPSPPPPSAVMAAKCADPDGHGET